MKYNIVGECGLLMILRMVVRKHKMLYFNHLLRSCHECILLEVFHSWTSSTMMNLLLHCLGVSFFKGKWSGSVCNFTSPHFATCPAWGNWGTVFLKQKFLLFRFFFQRAIEFTCSVYKILKHRSILILVPVPVFQRRLFLHLSRLSLLIRHSAYP